MKISILSDLHIDFYIRDDTKLKNGTQFKSQLDKFLDYSEDVEVLIVAGDISHYSKTGFKILQDIGKTYNYKKIFCVLGNHDLYLISGAQKKKYKSDSKNRMNEWYDFEDPNGVVQILNGEIQEYKGIKFGGAMMWYDASYGRNPMMYGTSEVDEWKMTMNDSNLIYGIGDFYDMFAMEHNKIRNIIDADIIITHFCPLSAPMAFQEQYRYEKSSKFYAYDGAQYLDETQAKYHIYGHSHGHHEFEVFGTKCIMNALGYPNEHGDVKKTVIEI